MAITAHSAEYPESQAWLGASVPSCRHFPPGFLHVSSFVYPVLLADIQNSVMAFFYHIIYYLFIYSACACGSQRTACEEAIVPFHRAARVWWDLRC